MTTPDDAKFARSVENAKAIINAGTAQSFDELVAELAKKNAAIAFAEEVIDRANAQIAAHFAELGIPAEYAPIFEVTIGETE